MRTLFQVNGGVDTGSSESTKLFRVSSSKPKPIRRSRFGGPYDGRFLQPQTKVQTPTIISEIALRIGEGLPISSFIIPSRSVNSKSILHHGPTWIWIGPIAGHVTVKGHIPITPFHRVITSCGTTGIATLSMHVN